MAQNDRQSTRNTQGTTGRSGDVQHADPRQAAQDPQNAARQAQTKRDHDDMLADGRRIEASAPSTPAQDPANAARQQQVERDHDEMMRQTRRVEASVPEDQRDKTVGEIVDQANRRADREERER